MKIAYIRDNMIEFVIVDEALVEKKKKDSKINK